MTYQRFSKAGWFRTACSTSTAPSSPMLFCARLVKQVCQGKVELIWETQKRRLNSGKLGCDNSFPFPILHTHSSDVMMVLWRNTSHSTRIPSGPMLLPSRLWDFRGEVEGWCGQVWSRRWCECRNGWTKNESGHPRPRSTSTSFPSPSSLTLAM